MNYRDKYHSEYQRLDVRTRYEAIMSKLKWSQYRRLDTSMSYIERLKSMYSVTKSKKILNQVPQLIADFEYLNQLYKRTEIEVIDCNPYAVKTYEAQLKIVS